MKKLFFGFCILSCELIFAQALGYNLANYPTGGWLSDSTVIPAVTVNSNSTFNVIQTTVGQTIKVPLPTNLLLARTVMIRNRGTVDFILNPGGLVVHQNSSHPATSVTLTWTGGTQWVVTANGASGAYQMPTPQAGKYYKGVTSDSTGWSNILFTDLSGAMSAGSGSSSQVMVGDGTMKSISTLFAGSETDPTVPSVAKTLDTTLYLRKLGAASLYQAKGTYVNTFNGRSGGITPQSSDYSSFYQPITYTPSSSDIISGLGYVPINPNGTTAQYFRGNGSLATFPTSNASFTNGAGYLTTEVDGSITNEIEIPTQTSQSGKFLSTNGTIPSWQTALASEVDGSITNEIELPTQAGQAGKVLGTNGGSPLWTTPTNQTITLSGDVSGSGATSITTTLANSGITPGTYNTVTVDAKGRVTSGNIAVPAQVSRSLNSSYQVSTTQPSRVSYTVSVSSAISIGAAQAFLEISINNVTWVTVGGAGESSVALLNTKLYNLQCEVPLGYYVRIRTNVTGGGAVAYSYGQETTY